MAQSRTAKKAIHALLQKELPHLTDAELASVIREISACASILESTEKRRVILDALAISSKREGVTSALLSILHERVSRDVIAAILHRRVLDALPQVLGEVRRAYEARGLGRFAVVESAVALEPSELASMLDGLMKRWNMPVELEQKMDPSLLGGWRIRSRDWVLDATVRGRLKRLATAFALTQNL